MLSLKGMASFSFQSVIRVFIFRFSFVPFKRNLFYQYLYNILKVMKIKGTAVKATPEYIKKFYNDRYNEWLNKLPEESRELMSKPVIATDWYPLTESVTIPTRIIAEMIFDNDEKKAASEMGKYSADIALKGVYKIFVMISTPSFMLSRASSIFATYYQPSDIKIVESSGNHATIEIKGFEQKDIITAYRIAGWIERALEFVKRKNIKTEVTNVMEPENEKVIIVLNWD